MKDHSSYHERRRATSAALPEAIAPPGEPSTATELTDAALGADARICAVIVTHFPRQPIIDRIAMLAPQVSEIVLVDNGSTGEPLASLEDAAAVSSATLIRLGDNRGIAHALNVGLEFARRQQCHWLATFDQDSIASDDMLEDMLQVARRYPYAERIGMIAPVHIDRWLGFNYAPVACERQGPGWRVLYTSMTSGNLLAVSAATAVGGFEEALFIDYVDHELCLRLRRNGYHVLEASQVHLTHSLGSLWAHRLGRRALWVTHHSATRRYYMTRNRLILWARYGRSEGRWVRSDMLAFVRELLGILLYERERSAKLGMVLLGVLDAMRGVRGPLKSTST